MVIKKYTHCQRCGKELTVKSFHLCGACYVIVARELGKRRF